MLVTSGEWISAEYDTFQVKDGSTNCYRIWLTGFSGDCGDSMNYAGRLYTAYNLSFSMDIIVDFMLSSGAKTSSISYGFYVDEFL